MKFLPQLRSELEPVHAVGKIVVGEYEVGPDRPSCHQIQRRDAVARCCRAMAFVLEESSSSSRTSGSSSTTRIVASAVSTSDGPVIRIMPTDVQVAVLSLPAEA